MTVQEQLVTLLTGATAAGVRVYPILAPQATIRPYVVYQSIFSNSNNVLSGDSGLVNTRMQIDCFADSYGATQTLAAQVDALMAGWALQNVSLGARDIYEQDVKIFRVSADYSIWHT